MQVASFELSTTVHMNRGARILSIQAGRINALINPAEPLVPRHFGDSGSYLGMYIDKGIPKYVFEKTN